MPGAATRPGCEQGRSHHDRERRHHGLARRVPLARPQHPPAGLRPRLQDQCRPLARKPLLALQESLSELTGPVFGQDGLDPLDNDLILNGRVDRDPIGERIIVHGRVLDENARPVTGALLEFWQWNSAGRYRHVNDHYVAPIDPNSWGCGRCLTDEEGWYCFRTIKPGPYPWRNRIDDWRPAHIHFSVFGHAFVQRLITQMYFEGDRLLKLCPIYHSIPDAGARERLSPPSTWVRAWHWALLQRDDNHLCGLPRHDSERPRKIVDGEILMPTSGAGGGNRSENRREDQAGGSDDQLITPWKPRFEWEGDAPWQNSTMSPDIRWEVPQTIM